MTKDGVGRKRLDQEMFRRWFNLSKGESKFIEEGAENLGISEGEYIRRLAGIEVELNKVIIARDEFIIKQQLEIERLIRIPKKMNKVTHLRRGFEVTTNEEKLDEIIAEEKDKDG